MLSSSRLIRRLINVLIHIANRYLPLGERIDKVDAIPFFMQNRLEIAVLAYSDAILSFTAEGLDRNITLIEGYVPAQTRIDDLEAKYGTELNEYLRPFEEELPWQSWAEGHRIQVARYRACRRT